MKRCKTLSVFLLAVCLLLELSGEALAAGLQPGLERFTNRNTYTASTFTDITAGSWYYENVKSVYELDLMVGSGTRFNPNGNITIAEVVAIAARLHAAYHGNAIQTGGAGAWYQPYVEYALKNGIIPSAYSNYGSAATRLQFVAILSKALPEAELEQINQVADNAIPDVKSVDTGADGVYLFYRAGILVGNDDKGTFAPSSTIRRSEVAAIVTRMVRPGLRAAVTLGGAPQISLSDREIHSKPLDETHVKTGMMTYEGETSEVLYVDNELILVGGASASRTDIQSIAAGYGGTVVGQIPLAKFYQVEFGSAKTLTELEALANAMEKNSKISAVFVNMVHEYEFQLEFTNDTYITTSGYNFGTPWNDSRTWHLRAAHVPEAWELVRKVNKSPSIKLGTIDDSIDDNNKDLNLLWTYYVKGTSQSKWSSRNFPQGAEHGTHVAGIMAATVNNKQGVAGVALNADLYAVACRKNTKVGKDEDYMDSYFEEASSVYRLLEKKCKVINISAGHGKGKSLAVKRQAEMNEFLMSPILDIVEEYLEYDFLIVTSAGNSGNKDHDVNYNNAWTKVEDSRLKSRILVVGNADDPEGNGHYRRAADSSYKGGRVDVMAPGTLIFSLSPYDDPNNECVPMSGTSMASPFAAGVAALVWEANSDLSGAEVKQILMSTANIKVQDSYRDMVDAEAAVQRALEKAGYFKSVTFRFRDKITGAALSANSVKQEGIEYAGYYEDADLRDWNCIYVNMSGNTINAGACELPYGRIGLRFSAQGYEEKTVYFTVDDETDTVLVEMQPTNAAAGSLICTVKDQDDSLVENAVVVLTADRQTRIAVTNPSGACAFDMSWLASVISPQWSLSVESTDAYTYDPAENPTASGTGSFDSFCGELYVRRSGQKTGQGLTVLVLDDAERPVEGAVVHYYSPTQEQTVVTDAGGWATFGPLYPEGEKWMLYVESTDEYAFDEEKNAHCYGFDNFDSFNGVGAIYVRRKPKRTAPSESVQITHADLVLRPD